MFFESKLGKFEVDLLRSLVGQTYKNLVHDEDGSLINLSGIVITTEDQNLAIFSDYWYADSDDRAVKYFELARFELDVRNRKRTQKMLRTGRKTTFGEGQNIQDILIVRSSYSGIDYGTDIFKSVKVGDDTRYEFVETISASLDFVTDSGLVFVFDDKALYIHFEHPYFQMFQVDFLRSITELHVQPQTRVFEDEIREGQFKYELIAIENLMSSL